MSTVESEPDTVDCCGCQLSKCQRYVLFGIFAVVGIGMSLGSIFTGFTGNTKSVILVTIGNILVIVSTFFLNGFREQLAKMMNPIRASISVGYIAIIVMSLLSVLLTWNKVIVIILFIAQEAFMVLYILSYFPALNKCLKDCCCGGKDDKSAPMA